MNIPISPSEQALGDFVFRSADRMRIEGCCNAIAREGLSLALHCEQEPLLDHYLGLMLHRLREQAPEHSIEVYFPTNTESLLGRFNEALARQTVEQATQKPTDRARARIWIVHDAQALPESEIQLLARLIQNFPGANIRAVLLMSGAHSEKTALSAFGRKILRWDIEVPTLAQSQDALASARAQGLGAPVQQLIQRIHRQAWPEDAIDLADSASSAGSRDETDSLARQSGLAASAQLQTFHAKGREALARSARLLGHWGPGRLRLLIGVVVALAASTLIMVWLQPEAFGIGPDRPAPNVSTPVMPQLVLPPTTDAKPAERAAPGAAAPASAAQVP